MLHYYKCVEITMSINITHSIKNMPRKQDRQYSHIFNYKYNNYYNEK